MVFKWENVSLLTSQSGRLFAASIGQGHLPLSTSLEWSNLLYHTIS